MRKVDISYNRRLKLKIFQSNTNKEGWSDSSLELEKTSDYYHPVISTSTKNPIKFTNEIRNMSTRLLIPFQGGWEHGCKIINSDITQSFFIAREKDYGGMFENIKNFLESKLISFLIVRYSGEYKKYKAYNFLTSLPELDFTREWSDIELYDEFNITQKEQKEIEDWYSEWKT